MIVDCTTHTDTSHRIYPQCTRPWFIDFSALVKNKKQLKIGMKENSFYANMPFQKTKVVDLRIFFFLRYISHIPLYMIPCCVPEI